MNRHKRCPVCHWNHRPGNCKETHEADFSRIGGEGKADLHFRSADRFEGLRSPSRVILTVDLTPLTERLDSIGEKLDSLIERFPITP